MMKKKFFLTTLLTIILSACAPAEPLLPAPELPILEIGYSPNLETYRDLYKSCGDENLEVLFGFQPTHTNSDQSFDLEIRLGEPEEISGFIAQIGSEKIVGILHPSNPVSLTQTEIQNIFTGRINNWVKVGDQGEIKVWVLPPENETTHIFKEFYLEGMFLGGDAQIAPGPAQVLESVKSDPASIGYLPQSWVSSAVNTIDLGIEVPILVTASAEPEGALREFVACLQNP